MKYEKDFLIGLYKTMAGIRLCEDSLIEPILNGEIRCPVHLYSGEEAVATGVCAALKETDYVFSTHRSHGHYLAKGAELKGLIAEVFGKETGCSRGRGGSMHLAFPEKGMLGSAPIVAGTISLALGASLASLIRKDNRVTVSFFGDGATGEGVLYESLNFAALKKLPVIFVCENNLYSTHLPIKECRSNQYIYRIGKPFDIKTSRIDGNNVLKVYETARDAVDGCRKGYGPFFIECATYRLRGHVGPDDNIQGNHIDIRPEKEIEVWRKKDPVKIFKKYLIKNRLFTLKELSEIENNIEAEIREAHKFAKESLYPEPEELTKYVYME
jgi:acetoin:2,6-dichlorophenolindophenol oxidoreductase subunit alpha